ncbi:MAG: PLP-dependent transferase [Gemmatimonadaceae bacterium]|nr:PLP-dependent transferase [Gemmatimonadaceae bacterium]
MSDRHPETDAIRLQAPITSAREHAVPLYLTSSFRFDDYEHGRALFAEEQPGLIYSRYDNPNTNEFVDKLCALEGAEAGIATASGMAAVFSSIASLVSAGDHVVSSRAVFGSTHQIFTRILPKWGVTVDYADASDPESFVRALRPTTRVVYVETPSNPGLELIDLRWLAGITRARGIPLVVDNCFATPCLQRPLALGADVVIHSATKYIDGQGRTLGGAIVGARALVQEARFFARHTGPALSPFNAWVLSKSLETLALRMDRHCASALTIARALEGHAALDGVRYPGLPSHPDHALARAQMSQFGGVVCLDVRGGLERCRRVVDALRMCTLSANLGDTRTIVTHPASTTHARLSEEERQRVRIGPGLLRVSVGLEHPDDILADLRQALDAAD